MADRTIRSWSEPLRWVFLGTAVVALVVFLLAQRQSIEVSYGQSPSANSIAEGTAGELSDATVPPVAEMAAMVDADAVVRLPGSVAHWDEQRVRAAIGDSEIRIIVAPPGLDEDERRRVRDVQNATIRVIGTQVSGGIYQAVADDLSAWRAQFATGDVTGLLLTLIVELRDDAPAEPAQSTSDDDGLRWREPSEAELRTVATDLRASGLHVADGATLTEVPGDVAITAFPTGDALYVALPQQPFGEPIPRYGPALTDLFPGRPIVVLYGTWIEYHGPHAADFAEVAGASFYSQFANRLSRYDYPQRNVLFAYLNRVTDVRYAGLFDRPLPYRPIDPLRVALPALPWLFAGCVVVFLALSVRSLRAPTDGSTNRLNPLRRLSAGVQGGYGTGTPARLAGLTALAIEMSLLTDRRSDPALTRGISTLGAARAALDEDLPDRQVRALLDDAEAELDHTARSLGFAFYRPEIYLRDRLT